VIVMELRHLRYFVAIAEEGSFTRAAERLWIAQPGLSTQIRRLEAELGMQLLERHTRGVELTDAGKLFLERARTALAAAEAARSTGADMKAGLVGAVRLGIATEAGWHLTPELLEAFGLDRPAVELTTFESYAGALLRDLRDRRLDAVLAPSDFGSPELFRAHLGKEPWLVVAGASHRLAGASGPVAGSELAGERLVATRHRDGAAYDRAVTATLAELGVAPEVHRGGSGPALFTAVASGDALALTTSPELCGGLVGRPLEPPCQLDFALLWRDETSTPAVNQFIQAAASIAQSVRPRLRPVA
jgi:DNA-binding transcriptional LysR family regulator